MTHFHAHPQRRSQSLRHVALASALLAATAAQAVVGPPVGTDSDGSLTEIGYGNTGIIAELIPRLFVQGLGGAASPLAVTALNPLLQYNAAVTGDGTDTMTVEYSLRNTSAVQSFDQLRFMVFASPDGGANFIDQVAETWGSPPAAGDPTRREARAPGGGLNILSGIALNGNLTEGATPLDALCTGAGCDVNIGLQWNADLLGPGQTFRVRLGLSDTGNTLSGRFLSISSVTNPGTVLTMSGVSAVVAVPEPATTALMLAGLLGIGFLAQRRTRAD